VSVSFLCLSCLRRTSVWYTLSSVVDIVGHRSRHLSSVDVHCYWNILSYSCLFPHYMCWVHLHHLVLNFTGVVPLACSSSIILCTLTFDHIFSRTTCQLMVQKYNILMVPSYGCVITGGLHVLINLWSRGWMMPFQWNMHSDESSLSKDQI
jgi:hypothetical protein